LADDGKPRSHEQYSVEDKGKAASAFDRAQQIKQEKQAPERMESEQVKKSAPGMQPKPPGHVRGAVDREAHNRDMAKDTDRLERKRELAASINKDKDRQPEKSREREQER